MNFIKKLFSGNIFLKIGAAASFFAILIGVFCLVKYTVKTNAEKNLEEEGYTLYSEDLSDEYYKEISSRFLNQSGETYEHYRMLEGVGVSFYGDGGVIDQASGYSLPSIISINFLERFIYIMGNRGETIESIAAKQGGLPMYTNPFIIPAGQETVKVTLKNEYGETIVPILENNGGLNPCTIGGITGYISVDEYGNTYFTRAESGMLTFINAGEEVITRAMLNRRGDITVVFLQELPENYSATKFVEVLEKMRDYQNISTGEKCFYVISPILNTDEASSAELDSLLEEHFGEYYINAREYLCGEAIEKYNIRIRDEDDLALVEKGQVCSQFLTRDNTLNLYGMYIISELFTETIKKNDAELLEIRFEYTEEQ